MKRIYRECERVAVVVVGQEDIIYRLTTALEGQPGRCGYSRSNLTSPYLKSGATWVINGSLRNSTIRGAGEILSLHEEFDELRELKWEE
jgi:hypothetical protein